MPVHPEPDDKERKIINENNMVDNKIICAVDGMPVGKSSGIEYHHMRPYLAEKKQDISNIVTVCRSHHKELGQLSVTELIAYKQMERFFRQDGLRRLDDVLAFKLYSPEEKLSGGQISGHQKNGNNSLELDYQVNQESNLISIKLDKNDNNDSRPQQLDYTLPLSSCPSTGFKYFYAVLPLAYINNDTQLQPRPLEFKRLWELYRHLLVNSQLTPSLCRLAGKKIYLFDGQHKAAAQIWAGRKEIECKIYIEPLLKTLKETNLVAHDKLRQMPFFTSVLINKWASIFSEEWKIFMEARGAKSEASFVSFLVSMGKKRSEALHMIESNIYDSILEDDSNTLKKYLAEYNQDTRSPLTVARLKTSFFKKFITNPPLEIDIEQSDRLREYERKNTIRILNLIVKYSLDGMWKPDDIDEIHQCSERIYLGGSFKAVCAMLKDVIAAILELYDEGERKEMLLRQISDENWDLIENAVAMFFSHRVWSDNSQENYNNLRMSNETLVKKYLARRGLSVNWVLNNSFDSGNNFID